MALIFRIVIGTLLTWTHTSRRMAVDRETTEGRKIMGRRYAPRALDLRWKAITRKLCKMNGSHLECQGDVHRIAIGRYDDQPLRTGDTVFGSTLCTAHAEQMTDILRGHWIASRNSVCQDIREFRAQLTADAELANAYAEFMEATYDPDSERVVVVSLEIVPGVFAVSIVSLNGDVAQNYPRCNCPEHQPKTHNCPRCGEGFGSETEMLIHLTEH